MKAVIYTAPGEVSTTTAVTPSLGEGDVLIKVLSNTICGTDLRIAKGLKRKGVIAPRILGHEVAGVIEHVGSKVTDYQPGQQVGMCPTYSCGSCRECERGRTHLCSRALVLGHQTDGGLAEYILVPALGVAQGVIVAHSGTHAPEVISLAEPLSCVIHGQSFLSITPGDVVTVIGGGAIGLMHAQVAKLAGASTVILSEPVEFRRTLASEFGADITVNPEVEDLDAIVREHSNGAGSDVVIVCIGVPALVNVAFSIAANRGRVSLFAGFPADEASAIDANLVHYRELSVVGSSNSTVPDYHKAIDLIDSGKIPCHKLITHRFGLEDYALAVDTIAQPHALKVAILPYGE
jgi:L-iditol 2-dehydrogenase